MPPRKPLAQIPPSNFVRNLVLALIGLPFLCGGCGLVGFVYVRDEMGYQAAVDRAVEDPRVKKLLGEPVTASFFFSGQGKGRDDIGMAVMSISLQGSQQNGTLLTSGVKTSGVWGFSKLQVTADNGKQVSLVKD